MGTKTGWVAQAMFVDRLNAKIGATPDRDPRGAMSENYSISRDIEEVEAMAKALPHYIRQDMLYGSVGSGGLFSSGNMPSMTIGALLMRMRRLHVLRDHLDQKQLARLRKVEHRNEEVRDEWRFHCEQKILREANSRLDAMLPFFSEYRKNPDFGAQVYKPEALRRTIVQELFFVIEEYQLGNDDLIKKMQAVDGQLRGCVGKSDFIWAEILQPAYPEETFWWLYRRPVPRR
jgi:hypothetical protein